MLRGVHEGQVKGDPSDKLQALKECQVESRITKLGQGMVEGNGSSRESLSDTYMSEVREDKRVMGAIDQNISLPQQASSAGQSR